jgi:hypothetical protein
MVGLQMLAVGPADPAELAVSHELLTLEAPVDLDGTVGKNHVVVAEYLAASPGVAALVAKLLKLAEWSLGQENFGFVTSAAIARSLPSLCLTERCFHAEQVH